MGLSDVDYFGCVMEAALVSTLAPEGQQFSDAWAKIIESLPMLSETYYFHLFEQRECSLTTIIGSVCCLLLRLFTIWPTKEMKTRSYVKFSIA